MLYDISVQISYAYENAANSSRDVVRLMPLDLPGEQRLIAGNLDVRPDPDERIDRVDFFGNPYAELAFRTPHHEIEFLVKSRVERVAVDPELDISPRLDRLPEEIESVRSVSAEAPHHFLGVSERVALAAETTDYAKKAAGEAASVMQAVRLIGEALHGDMKFDPDATTVDTPMLEAFRARHGVCQDFTHIMIACLRGIGVPAGYVSGFLRTLPPPGEARLEGADAMHAWVRAWCGTEMGWVEYDPTNALSVGTDHIVVARGRDYSDVSPVRGVMRTHGEQESKHAVDVTPVIG